MTIILDPAIRSLSEYLRLKKRHNDAEQQNGEQPTHQMLIPKRPVVCPECQATRSFWIKGYYFRWVVEGDLTEALPVPRYICRCCSKVFSILFAFVVPYRHFTLQALARGIQNYILTKTTYRETAGEIANQDDSRQRPSHSQVWTWVDLFASSSLQKLEIKIQRACMKASMAKQLTGFSQPVCPNCINAQSLEKVHKLNCANRVLALTALLLQPKQNLVEALQTYFVEFVQPACSILTGRSITLASPQSSQHLN